MLRKLTWAMLLALGVGLTACTTLALAEDDDENETTIKFSEAPKAVQDTFKKEAKGGATPETLVKEIEDGKTVYEAEVTVDGKKWEIEVGEDGTVLEREAADDDDDDDDADEDDDDKKEESKQQTEKK
jgi:hypothetical protein